ncbi:aryl-alcohol dehydrogenase, putative [Talaromyces stipitatus ATCC 10500]|uniref:Aryl-alcohol dehydrogenase, putative n=1 Tax=Talaromyces stipitatus (strain ATCC 10500 / CBS 375.48 / QM 6759 / NRRL 1006) TaxID=441959 RepID=B8MNB6_TALSN|nr:aryl-alcohol dehydrogenase, putative [Talaromyces stipitatus ATCC 10500]EED14005.1 aryl-alcohol dehydrogenase, putative [Talaromyces stipitatus ATCC 10500]
MAHSVTSLPDFLEDSYPFDYVIVGGGTAGLVLAARLTEDPSIRVGVIEAGKSRLGDMNVDMPTGMSAVLHNPEYDWMYKSTPQAGTNNQIHHVARGKLVGGSSGVNFLAYCRPSAEDIDYWGKLGNKGWSWTELAPYYHKSETQDENSGKQAAGKADFYSQDSVFHGHSGPIKTSFPPWRVPVEDSIMEAFDEVSGVARPKDPWSGNHVGFYGTLSTIDRKDNKAVRSYAATGYLQPNIERKNLKVLTDATVTKVLLDQDTSTAKGVEFLYEKATYQVLTTTEVILSASSIQSPRLLELSGIGDPKVLQAAGVDCVIQLPGVGSNLQEHPMTSVTYELAPDQISLDSLFKDPSLLQEHQQLLGEKGSGAFAGTMSLTGFLPYPTIVSPQEVEETAAKITKSTAPIPEVEAENIISHLRSPKSAAVQFTGVPANFDLVVGHGNQGKLMPGAPPGRNACYTALVSLAYPLSRGSTHILSSDPFLDPEIDLGLLAHPADAHVLAAGLGFVDRVFQSPRIKKKIAGRIDPGPEVDLQDREQGISFARDRTMTFNHLLGTCAMGIVVDERLRVKGVNGLRVVDASVIPAQVGGNILATVYAIAEKAADMIKADRT